jgi:hypothetical protein
MGGIIGQKKAARKSPIRDIFRLNAFVRRKGKGFFPGKYRLLLPTFTSSLLYLFVFASLCAAKTTIYGLMGSLGLKPPGRFAG